MNAPRILWSAGISFVGVCAFYAPTISAYAGAWQEQAYSYGYIVAAAVSWLVWRFREALRRPSASIWRPPLYLGVGLSLLWLMGAAAASTLLGELLFPFIALSWIGAIYGRESAIKLLPVAITFLLAVPIWEPLTVPLQWMTISVSGTILSLLNIPALVEGSVIHTPFGAFLVEEGCAGLGFLLAGVFFGSLYAVAFLRSGKARIAAVAATAVTSVIANWTRVTSLVVIGYETRLQSSLMEGHFFFGWAIFAVSLVAVVPLLDRLARWDRRAAANTAPRDHAGVSKATPDSDRPLGRQVVLPATIAVVVGPLLFYAVASLPSRPVPPLQLDAGPSGWQRIQPPSSDRFVGWAPSLTGSTTRQLESWTRDGTPVFVSRIVYPRQRPAAHVLILEDRVAQDRGVVAERFYGPVGDRAEFVREVIVREGERYLLVWYWYRVGGVEAAQSIEVRLLNLLAFFTRSTESEVIIVSTPCNADSCASAARTLGDFLSSG